MNKIMIAIILGIALISLASAETIIAGECLSIDLSEMESLDNIVYDVVGNESNLEGLTIDLNGTTANICTVLNYKPDSFTIIFIDNSTKEIIKEVPSGGGRGRTKYIEKNVTEYIEVECIETECEIDPTQPEEPSEPTEPEEKTPRYGLIILGSIILISIIVAIEKAIERSRRKKQ